VSGVNRIFIVLVGLGALPVVVGCRSPQVGAEAALPIVNLVDEFSLAEPSDSWQFGTPQRWRIVAEGERRFLHLSEPLPPAPAQGPVPHPLEQAVHRAHRFRSFSLSCWVRPGPAGDGATRDACILFGRQDEQSYFCFRLSRGQRELEASLLRVDSGRELPLTPGGSPLQTGIADQGWHRVDILRDVGAGTIEILLDRTRPALLRVRDKSYPVGGLALGSASGGVGFGQVLISGESAPLR
jgi:hypothetical protein